MMKAGPNIITALVISLAGALLFIPFLGHVPLFDWDEINFAESAREMLVTGNYYQVQIDYVPFWEKPPLFFWLQALSMKIFGVNEFAARFPDALCGIITLNVIYFIGRRHYSPSLAAWWVLCYLGAFTPHLYFKAGIIDPVYNLFIFLALYQLYLASSRSQFEGRRRQFILAGLFTGLAILTKGPVAIIVLSLCAFIFWLMQRFRTFFNTGDILAFIITVFAVSFAWFGPETIRNGPWFLERFIRYQAELFSQPVAGHGQPFWYHPLVLLFGCFPVSLIAIKGFKKQIEIDNSAEVAFKRWLTILFWVVLILFSIVKTKIVHYSSLCWLPLTFLAAFAVDNITAKKFAFEGWLKALVLLFGIIMAAAIMLVPLILSDNGLKTRLLENMKDEFARAGFAQQVHWGGWEWGIGLVYLIMIVWSAVNLFRGKEMQGILLLLVSTLITVQLAAWAITPKIERYSQGAAVDFFKSLRGKDVYVETVGYKSYAQYFYSLKMPSQRSPYSTVDSLITQPADKPAYFITKITSREKLDTIPALKQVEEKGGFVMYRKEAGR